MAEQFMLIRATAQSLANHRSNKICSSMRTQEKEYEG
jgi:hypothetical protein